MMLLVITIIFLSICDDHHVHHLLGTTYFSIALECFDSSLKESQQVPWKGDCSFQAQKKKLQYPSFQLGLRIMRWRR